MARAELGRDRGAGNVVGFQLAVGVEDYASETRFATLLGGAFDAARRAGWLRDDTIAVLPEHVGSWLLFAHEPRGRLRLSLVPTWKAGRIQSSFQG